MNLTDRIHLALIRLLDDKDTDAALQEIIEAIGYEYNHPVGSRVMDHYGNIGIVIACYSSWEDLKQKNSFLTIDPDNESEKMDVVEKIINGDPRDAWLYLQEHPFSDEELEQHWYEVKLDYGCIWCCDGRLKRSCNCQESLDNSK